MTNDDSLIALQELNDYCKEKYPSNGYPIVEWAINEIERLRQEVQNLSDISDGWWQFHIGKISPEEMAALLQKADSTAKRPIPGYYDADKRQTEEARRG